MPHNSAKFGSKLKSVAPLYMYVIHVQWCDRYMLHIYLLHRLMINKQSVVAGRVLATEVEHSLLIIATIVDHSNQHNVIKHTCTSAMGPDIAGSSLWLLFRS